jgi:hypothetical protein
MEPTTLESAILGWIAERTTTLTAAPREVAVDRREVSEAGSYTYLTTVAANELSDRIDGPQIKSPSLRHDAGSILWLKNGAPECLEVYAFHDKFSPDLVEFSLSAAASKSRLQRTREKRAPR